MVDGARAAAPRGRGKNLASRQRDGRQVPTVCLHRACESPRSEEHTSELQSLMRISYAVFCLKKKNIIKTRLTATKSQAATSRAVSYQSNTHTLNDNAKTEYM